MGVMADPGELLRALMLLEAIDRLPSEREHLAAERAAGSRELWRLQCAHHLAGAVEAQVLMAAGAAADVADGDSAPVMLAGWGLYAGAGMEGDAARIGLLLAITKRLGDQIMLMVARHRRGEGDELLSPLVMPALAVCEALAGVLDAAAVETAGEDEHPRAGLPRVVEQLRGMADLLETMTPKD